jgi:hypothetical protein
LPLAPVAGYGWLTCSGPQRQEADYQDAWWLASFAQDIVNRCSRASIEAGLQTWGQETDSWGFAVIAGHLGYC